MAALSVSYTFDFVRNLDLVDVTANPDAASLAGGGIALVADHAGHSDAFFFGPSGAPAGGPPAMPGTASAIAQLANGNIVLASDNGGQAFFSVASPTGATLVEPVASDTEFSQLRSVDVAALAGCAFVVASEALIEGTNRDIRLNIRDNDGALVTTFAVDGTTANDQAPSVAALPDGGFAVAWFRIVDVASELWYAVYEADGTVRKAPTLLDAIGGNLNPSVAALKDGGFAIVYEDTGWSATGDLDITLARLNADGSVRGTDDLSQNDFHDSQPSITVLSNGLIAVGSTSAEFTDNDPTWTLADPLTGDPLGHVHLGLTFANDTSTTLAAMANGQVAVFFSTGGGAAVVGQVLQARRHTSGDTFAGDLIIGDELVDFIDGNGGDDTIRGGGNADILAGWAGNDTFIVGAGEIAGDSINGDEDFDRILLLASADIGSATVANLEGIAFSAAATSPIVATVDAGQIGAGLASNLLVDASGTGPGHTLRVEMRATSTVSLADFAFVDFGPGDRVLIVGDRDAEAIVGSARGDTITSGGGNDTLTGGLGIDTLRGGAGSDTYRVNAAGEAVEAAGHGRDTVMSSVSYTLGANLEDLVLLGKKDIDGTGNGLKNQLTGNAGANDLSGGAGSDVLAGGMGRDVLTGGAGNDRFVYQAAKESGPGASDVITDFAGHGTRAGDRIDLSAIDANELAGGNQAFTFIGSAAFTAAGQVRYANGFLLANTDGDPQAELRIELTGRPPLVEADLVL